MTPRVDLVAGARPNFMKIAPLARALRADGRLGFRIVHTGQHHDAAMSDVFFEELGIPSPDVRLEAGGGTHAEQTARAMIGYERLCVREPAAASIVVGDVNSTLACALAAKKALVPVVHVEAGLRSGDMTMPEEVNRRATDAISDWLFVTEPGAVENLRREGHPPARIHHVGNVMVDTLFHQVARLAAIDPGAIESEPHKRRHARYGVVTLHRPSNVDDRAALGRLAKALREIAADVPLVFPAHPRTRKRLEEFEIDLGPRVFVVPPLGYVAFLHLWKDAAVVLTDSGGLQEETTALAVPCVTLRANTERPVTVEQGTNVLAGNEPAGIIRAARAALRNGAATSRRPALWDGHAAERIVAVLARELA
jgi:UDP-N-acetylglucosamine 2-epimerase (non-hydrolysing)